MNPYSREKLYLFRMMDVQTKESVSFVIKHAKKEDIQEGVAEGFLAEYLKDIHRQMNLDKNNFLSIINEVYDNRDDYIFESAKYEFAFEDD